MAKGETSSGTDQMGEAGTEQGDGRRSWWTPAREEKLKELWNEGRRSAAGIADLLDTTRNAVIGKIHRLGGMTGKKTTTQRERIAPVQPRTWPAIAKRRPGPRPPPPLPAKPPEFLGRKLEELGQQDCHFPKGDWPPFVYCGQPTANGSSYCATHHRLLHGAAVPPRWIG
jgi:GcrA cell cycle regulator